MINYEKVLILIPSNHLDLAKVYYLIANVHAETQNYSEALFNHEKALKIYESHLLSAYNPCHEKAVILQGIAYVHLLTENYELALVNYKNALTIGLTAPTQIISTYNIIGLLYKNQFKNYSEALINYKKALSIKLKYLSSDDTDIADLYISVAITQSNKKIYTGALINLIRALKIYENINSSDHPYIPKIQNGIKEMKEVLSSVKTKKQVK
ncbi:unnamed protein product [Didymodactylos carnosus]|uniref:Tetratricopeptide repeat protein n=1 Tax=Didymodactylos carnosus TaxID=1234261 RepID=A0A814HQE6_9BILA|nr:unnamed protein product [Didymodactylos carnosus]CAF1014430.1 unnamed protein product [Didymodactylos carnosus]CAF3766188.1 unnamed protein product [Didymodactylos carnosus]CAF3785889.1 unnamed protein product [Didymodactylos carnosus]